MANLFQNLLGPIAPGVSPTINPITMLGAGMYSGNPGAALAQMGEMQMAAQQLQAKQAMDARRMAMLEAEEWRKQQQQEALSRAATASLNPFLATMAPNVADEWRKTLEPLATGAPTDLLSITTAGLTPEDPSNALQIYQEQGGQAGTGKTFQQFYSEDYKGGGVQVSVGGPGELGSVPQGMARVEDPDSPTGTRLVAEPGSKAETDKLTVLGNLEDALNEYEATLKQYGPEIMAGEGRLALQSTYTPLLMQMKEADNLGALTGPDLELMYQTLTDPTSLTAQLYEKTGQTGALVNQLDVIRKRVQNQRRRLTGDSGKPVKTAFGAQGPSDAEFEAMPRGTEFTVGGKPYRKQ